MFDDWGDVLRLLLTGLVWTSAFWLSGRITRPLLRRQMARGRAHVSARSPAGTHPFLSPIWQDYRGTPHPGRLDLQHRRSRPTTWTG